MQGPTSLHTPLLAGPERMKEGNVAFSCPRKTSTFLHPMISSDIMHSSGLCTKVAAVGNRAVSSDTAWGTPTGICMGQDGHGGVGKDRAEHPLGTPTLPGRRTGVNGDTSAATAGHQPGAGARVPQHIQHCLSAQIWE